jgi:hypothetical protein
MLLHLRSVLAVLLGEGVLLGRLGVERLLLRGVEGPLECLLPRRPQSWLPA